MGNCLVWSVPFHVSSGSRTDSWSRGILCIVSGRPHPHLKHNYSNAYILVNLFKHFSSFIQMHTFWAHLFKCIHFSTFILSYIFYHIYSNIYIIYHFCSKAYIYITFIQLYTFLAHLCKCIYSQCTDTFWYW